MTCDVAIEGSRLKCSIALTDSVFSLIQADLNSAEQDAIRLKIASATEKALANIARECRGITIVAVASRPTLMSRSDLVVFLENGRLRSTGTHTELLRSDPSYRELMMAYDSEKSTTESEGSR